MGISYTMICGCGTSGPVPDPCEYASQEEYQAAWQAWYAAWAEEVARHHPYCCQDRQRGEWTECYEGSADCPHKEGRGEMTTDTTTNAAHHWFTNRGINIAPNLDPVTWIERIEAEEARLGPQPRAARFMYDYGNNLYIYESGSGRTRVEIFAGYIQVYSRGGPSHWVELATELLVAAQATSAKAEIYINLRRKDVEGKLIYIGKLPRYPDVPASYVEVDPVWYQRRWDQRWRPVRRVAPLPATGDEFGFAV